MWLWNSWVRVFFKVWMQLQLDDVDFDVVAQSAASNTQWHASNTQWHAMTCNDMQWRAMTCNKYQYMTCAVTMSLSLSPVIVTCLPSCQMMGNSCSLQWGQKSGTTTRRVVPLPEKIVEASEKIERDSVFTDLTWCFPLRAGTRDHGGRAELQVQRLCSLQPRCDSPACFGYIVCGYEWTVPVWDIWPADPFKVRGFCPRDPSKKLRTSLPIYSHEALWAILFPVSANSHLQQVQDELIEQKEILQCALYVVACARALRGDFGILWAAFMLSCHSSFDICHLSSVICHSFEAQRGSIEVQWQRWFVLTCAWAKCGCQRTMGFSIETDRWQRHR